MKKLSIKLIILVTALLWIPVIGSTVNAAKTDAPINSAIANAAGNADPAVPYRLACELSFEEIIEVIYKGSREERLASIDAVSKKSYPFDVLPYLAALMQARDRQVASRAALGVDMQIERIFGDPSGYYEILKPQASQLVDQLKDTAKNHRIDLDIRVLALNVLSRITNEMNLPQPSLESLFDDNETLVRKAAVAAYSLPIADKHLEVMAQAATSGATPDVRGMAAEMLCENALAYGVKEPSLDLKKILASVLKDRATPNEDIGAILGCISAFEPEPKDLVDLGLAGRGPDLEKLWNSLKE